MALYMNTIGFTRAATKAVTNLTILPDGMTKSGYALPDLLSNARAYLAAAEAVRAAAASVIEQLTPPSKQSEVHNHYSGPRPSLLRDGAVAERS